jgi:hypothetical protein
MHWRTYERERGEVGGGDGNGSTWALASAVRWIGVRIPCSASLRVSKMPIVLLGLRRTCCMRAACRCWSLATTKARRDDSENGSKVSARAMDWSGEMSICWTARKSTISDQPGSNEGSFRRRWRSARCQRLRVCQRNERKRACSRDRSCNRGQARGLGHGPKSILLSS